LRIVWGPAVPLGADLLSALDAEAEFGRDHDIVAETFQRPAELFLVLQGATDLGGVEERAAELDCAMKRRDRLALVRRPVGLAHPHAAEGRVSSREIVDCEQSWRR
jgi:hypothetical protein